MTQHEVTSILPHEALTPPQPPEVTGNASTRHETTAVGGNIGGNSQPAPFPGTPQRDASGPTGTALDAFAVVLPGQPPAAELISIEPNSVTTPHAGERSRSAADNETVRGSTESPLHSAHSCQPSTTDDSTRVEPPPACPSAFQDRIRTAFTEAILVIDRLPLSDAEKAAAVRAMLPRLEPDSV